MPVRRKIVSLLACSILAVFILAGLLLESKRDDFRRQDGFAPMVDGLYIEPCRSCPVAASNDNVEARVSASGMGNSAWFNAKIKNNRYESIWLIPSLVRFLIEPSSSANKIYILPVDQNGNEGGLARTEQEILPGSQREFNINARWASHVLQRRTFTELRLAFRDARSKEMAINLHFALAPVDTYGVPRLE